MCEIRKFKSEKEVKVFKVVYEKNDQLFSLFFNYELMVGKVEEKDYKYAKQYLSKNWNLDMRGKVSGFQNLETAKKLLDFAKKKINYSNLQIIEILLGGLLYKGTAYGILNNVISPAEKIFAGTEIIEINKINLN